MDDRQAPANSMMKSAASLKMDDTIIEIEEGTNTSTYSSPRRRCLTPDWQALADSTMESITTSVSKLRLGDPPTIYRVPQTIRQVNNVAYEPKIVSIGPYHKGKEKLQAMEEHKWVYLHWVLSRNTKYKLEHYLMAMSELEDEARSCYYDNVDLHPQVGNEFVKMMVLDACFIVELFLRFYPIELLRQQREELEQNEENLDLSSAMAEFFIHSNSIEDPILDSIGMRIDIKYDLLLLENQIPFFVLLRIFKMACPVKVPHLLENMAFYLFDAVMPRNKEIQIKDSCDQSKDPYCHLLHLFHSHLIPTLTHFKESNSTVESVSNKNLNLSCNHTVESVLNKLKNIRRFFPSSNKPQSPIRNNPSPVRMLTIPCAAELKLEGVKFKKKEGSSSILDVEFSHGVLEIPPLAIDDSSDTFFRNLVAFEQCWPKATDHFTAYFWFMDCLVNTSNDVALLHLNEIIDHGLGSDDDVAQLFNHLCTGIFYECKESYLSDLQQNVETHCKNKWNKWRAILKRDYFTNPWSVISLIAASILLLLTITQTFFSVFPYYRQRS